MKYRFAMRVHWDMWAFGIGIDFNRYQYELVLLALGPITLCVVRAPKARGTEHE